MISLHHRFSSARFLFVISTLFAYLLLTGCPTTSIFSPQTPSQSIDAQINLLLRDAEYAPINERIANYLEASYLLLKNGDTARANTILLQIDPQTVPANQAGFYKILKANIQLEQQKINESLTTTESITKTDIGYLTQPQHIQLAEIKAKQQYYKGNYIESINSLMFISPLLNDNERQRHHDTIWQTLMLLDTSALQAAMKNASNELRGWLELAIAQKAAIGPLQQSEAFSQWQERWSMHPAARIPPQSIDQTSTLSEKSVSHIAVLLPLTGKFASAGNAIKNGILLAHFNAQSNGESQGKLQFYDTNDSLGADIIYQNAQSQGAEFVIGPLMKENIVKLNNLGRFSTPILVLNQDKQIIQANNFYQFGLAIENEAEEVAQKAWERGYVNAAVLYPNSDWGKRALQAFEQKWSELGRQVRTKISYPANKHMYTEPVKQLLIHNGENLSPEDIKHRNIKNNNQRRQDIDFIFVIGNQVSLKQIKPTLNYFYADDIPVFTTSHGVQIGKNLSADPDLNGVEFCDMPWILRDDLSLKKQLLAANPNLTSDILRLYALGIDSYYLQSLLSSDSQHYTTYDGSSGQLEITQDGKIRRKLTWAKILNGRIVFTDGYGE